MYYLHFVAILQDVIGPLRRMRFEARCGRRWGRRAWAWGSLLGSLLLAAPGCREAATQPNTIQSLVRSAPQVVVSPAQDTTVDSLGTLAIVVAVHDQALIDSVAVLFQGASQAYHAAYPNDTVFQEVIQVALTPLKHRTFSFAVNAANILGVDTTTSAVNVRVL